MQIELNGEKLDFSLENERNLADVMDGLEHWLNESDMVVTSVVVNGKEYYNEARNAWTEIPVDKIENLELKAFPSQEVRLNSIQTTKEFLVFFLNAVRETDTRLLVELKSGYGYLKETLACLFGNNRNDALLNELGNSVAGIPGNWPTNAEKERILFILNSLLQSLEQLGEEEAHPVVALKAVTLSLKKSIDEIREVSVLLQTGKDKNAMDSIVSFSDEMQRLVTIMGKLQAAMELDLKQYTITGKSVETFYQELNAILKELIEAFGIRDFVLIGDLLEYEIAPRIEGIIEFCEKIEQGSPNR